MRRVLFVRWVAFNALFIGGLITAALAYHGHVHAVVYVAVGAVLAIYLGGALYTGKHAWEGQVTHRHANRIDRIAGYCPKVAMLGTVTGFLIAFSSSTGDYRTRILGAATALIATWVGIACMIALEALADLFEGDETQG